jgi:branched-chain amino acid transport system substrate-binding protein
MALTRRLTLAALAAAPLARPGRVAAQSAPLRVAIVTTLAGPQAVIGGQLRDGFMLGLRHAGDALGGRRVEVQVLDDELRPETAVQKVRAAVERDGVDFVVGPVFSNVLASILRPATSRGAFLISTNAGPSTFAGRSCHPNLFVVSYCNDQVHSVMGAAAEAFGYRRAYLMAPNYQAGRDAVSGFRSRFRGEVVDEVYVPLTQLDFSGELTRLAAARPDVLFTFMPGGLGVNLVRQFRQAGLTIPVLSTFTVDEASLPAQGDAAVGFYSAASWAPNMDNPRNRRFTAEFEAAHGAAPATYAAQAYDGAQLIDAALRRTRGSTDDKDRLREALRAAEFESVRGAFRFGANHYPVQDFWLLRVVRRPDGRLQTETVRRIFEQDVDPFAAECRMARS